VRDLDVPLADASLVESEGNLYATWLRMARRTDEAEADARLDLFIELDAKLLREPNDLPILHQGEMTNEWLQKREAPMTNAELRISLSGFVIDSSFVITPYSFYSSAWPTRSTCTAIRGSRVMA
jgi:hypothetical protein